jgi:hypothetical protein
MRWHFGHIPGHWIYGIYTVATRLWAGGAASPADLPAEIDARRRHIAAVGVHAYAFPPGVFIPPFAPGPYIRATEHDPRASSVTITAPAIVEMMFSADRPAVTLRVVATSSTVCNLLFKHMADHIDAGARPSVWAPESAMLLGLSLGVWIPVGLLFGGLLTEWTALLQVGLGAFGAYAGRSLADWAFPPLELIEPWEQSRWRIVKTRSWQLLTLGLAVGGIVIALILSRSTR